MNSSNLHYGRVLEPPMLAAIGLHQLANTLAPVARLVDTLAPLLAISPNPITDHPQRSIARLIAIGCTSAVSRSPKSGRNPNTAAPP
jgi:hypothetical protein